MKKLLLMAAAFLFVSSFAFAQKKPASPKMTAEAENVSITYSAPFKKGREVFGGLVPYDKVWRTGADNATEITFKKDAEVGGEMVKAGTYTLFTIPKKGQDWTVILNPTLGQWGAFGYDKIKDKDLKHIYAKSSKTDETVEQLNIDFEDGNLVLVWENSKMILPIKF